MHGRDQQRHPLQLKLHCCSGSEEYRLISGVVSAALLCGQEVCDTSSIRLEQPVRIELAHEEVLMKLQALHASSPGLHPIIMRRYVASFFHASTIYEQKAWGQGYACIFSYTCADISLAIIFQS